MNYDDLLIDNIPKNYRDFNLTKGIQFIGDFEDNNKFKSLKDIDNNLLNKIEIDFSGTISKFEFIKSYFTNRTKIRFFEEVSFMDYLDTQTNKTLVQEKPFIYHRCWSNSYPYLKDLKDTYDDMINTNNELKKKLLLFSLPIIMIGIYSLVKIYRSI